MTNNSEFETLALPVLRAGAVLGVGRTMTLGLVKNGDLESILIGRKRLILTASIRRYVEQRQGAKK